ncbi:hypothetical protein [Halomonas ramblicola]|uniref:hypothetical protein n=1 Tax=Halomonas ramblicola TaxID=747349 RepID=UPI0025B524B1|nr:hypothetical protein [Halomonas ramblicola]MDN3520704.1 hypothetical protein [Halomonas ramblicola]
MARLIGKLIGLIINIIMIPIVIVLVIPMGVLKARRAKKSRLLFTGEEQALLAKAQRAINMENNGLLSPDRDLLEVARCIEDARCDYQIIKNRERFDASFSEFVLPKIEECQVMDWDNVISYFELSRFLSSDSHHEVPSVQNLLRALQNYIAGYKNEHGFHPKTVMLDHNVHMMFAHAGIYRNGNHYFGETEIIPVANIEGGATWQAVDPAPASDRFDNFDDDIPF